MVEKKTSSVKSLDAIFGAVNASNGIHPTRRRSRPMKMPKLGLLLLFFFLIVFGAANFVANAGNLENCMGLSQTLCDEEALTDDELQQVLRHRSKKMLNTCKISSVLCKKEELLPEDLKELD